MTYEQFVDYALDLISHSDLIDDNWSIRDYKNTMVKYYKNFTT